MATKNLFLGLKISKPEPVDRLLSLFKEKVDLPNKFILLDNVKQV